MIEIETLAVIRGTIPARDGRIIIEWATEHRPEIVAAWNLLNPDLAI